MPADRENERGAGNWIRNHPGLQAKNVAHQVLGDHFNRWPLGDDRPGLHGDDVVGVTRCQVEVMQHDGHGGPPAAVEVGHQVQHLHLVCQVKVGGGFVKEQDLGLLRKGHGDPHPLALPTGQFVDVPFSKLKR